MVGIFFLQANLPKSPNIDVFLYCIILPSRYHPRGIAAIALLTEVSLYGWSILHWCANLCTKLASWLGTRDRKTAFFYNVVDVQPSTFSFAFVELKWTLCISDLKIWRSYNFLFYNWLHQQSECMSGAYSIKQCDDRALKNSMQ